MGRAGPTYQLLPAFIDLTEVGADVDIVKANVPIVAVHVGEGPVDEHVPILSGSLHPPPTLGSFETQSFNDPDSMHWAPSASLHPRRRLCPAPQQPMI